MIFQLLLVFFLSYALAGATESTAPALLHFTPQDTVKNVRQVTARTADDLSFGHSSWDEGTKRWRFSCHLKTTGALLLPIRFLIARCSAQAILST